MTIKYTTLFFILFSFAFAQIHAQTANLFNMKSNAKEKTFESPIKLYPNPATSGSYVNVEFKDFDSDKEISLTIINVIGKELINETVDSLNLKVHLQKNKFPSGIYIVKAKQSGKVRTIRLNVVQ